MTLQELLEHVTVGDVDEDHLQCNPTALGPSMLGWFYVEHGDHGVMAYFNDIDNALRYRLDVINMELNPGPIFSSEESNRERV